MSVVNLLFLPVAMTECRPTLREEIDFYREGTFVVFTESYLRSRGDCCESNCRHCPWDFRASLSADEAIDPVDEA